jgi:hypothetical protein
MMYFRIAFSIIWFIAAMMFGNSLMPPVAMTPTEWIAYHKKQEMAA